MQGVSSNRVQRAGHYRLLREAVEAETGLARRQGTLRPDASVTIPDRHLGLRTAIEAEVMWISTTDWRSRPRRRLIWIQVAAIARSAGGWFEEIRSVHLR